MINRHEEALMLRISRLIAGTALILALSSGSPAIAQPAPDAVTASRELVTVMRAADQLKALFPIIMQQLKPAIVQGRPEVERDYDVLVPIMLEIADRYSAAMIEEVAALYARNFSAAELREVTAFYRAPVGQKMLQKLPAIAQESMIVGQKFGQSVAGELRTRMIEELRKRGHKI
jgi:uncharacterized protein